MSVATAMGKALRREQKASLERQLFVVCSGKFPHNNIKELLLAEYGWDFEQVQEIYKNLPEFKKNNPQYFI